MPFLLLFLLSKTSSDRSTHLVRRFVGIVSVSIEIDRDRPRSTQISISSVARLTAVRKTRGFVQGLYENRIIVNVYVEFASVQRIPVRTRNRIIPTST
jgi:hypothetical protein